MSNQTTITGFFNSRKRSATSSAPSRSKLLILEAQGAAKKKLQVPVEVTPQQEKKVVKEPEKKVPEKKTTEAPSHEKVKRSLNFEQLKKKIAGNASVRDKLKSSLDKFQKLDAKLQIQPFEKPLVIELPESPIKKPIYASPLKSPLKSPVKSALPQSPSKARVSLKFESEKEALALPQSYQLLHASFKAMDVAACMLENRKEKVTLSKVTTAVEQITRMNFGRPKLGQIKAVDPDCVECRVFKDDLELDMQFTKDAQGKAWACLAKREKLFQSKLIDMVKNFHQEFLTQLRPPLVISPDKVIRWHPEFEPNSVPEIKPAALPESNKNKVFTASEVLEANSWLKSNARVAQALSKLKKDDDMPAAESAKTPEPLNPCFKGLPQSLLEKIRQKQAEKARLISLNIMRPSEKEEERRRHERLPMLAKYVRNIFVSEKKSVLRLEALLERLTNCFPHPLSNCEFEQHIELILKGAPGWVEKIVLRKNVYIRVVKQVEFDHLQKIFEDMLTKN